MDVPVSDETSQEERRLSKYSNADRAAAYSKASAPQAPAAAAEGSQVQAEMPLSHLLEHLIRDGGLEGGARSETEQRIEEPLFSAEGSSLSPKLIEELRSGQEETRAQAQTASLPDNRVQTAVAVLPSGPANAGLMFRTAALAARIRDLLQRFKISAVRHAHGDTARRLSRMARALPPLAAAGGRAALRGSVRLMRALRIREWHRRYLILLTLLHRHLFDRRVERLLFIKTPSLERFRPISKGSGEFHYQGPMARKVLEWAMSALPGDLKHYAFIDFRAERGRTLLLAARRNFEYAAGYSFDAKACEELELNLAQYPRSYMSCRDVRALRGDRDGAVIPEQPAVLFVSDGVRETHLAIIMSYVSASYRLNLRPIYLIFENAGRERALDQMEVFERVPLPILNRIKASLFSPAKVAVYVSKGGAGGA